MRLKIFLEDAAEVALGASIRRAVVVGEIEMSDAEIERGAQDLALALERRVVAEVVPEPQRQGRQLQAAAADRAIRELVISVAGRDVGEWRALSCPDGSKAASEFRESPPRRRRPSISSRSDQNETRNATPNAIQPIADGVAARVQRVFRLVVIPNGREQRLRHGHVIDRQRVQLVVGADADVVV